MCRRGEGKTDAVSPKIILNDCDSPSTSLGGCSSGRRKDTYDTDDIDAVEPHEKALVDEVCFSICLAH